MSYAPNLPNINSSFNRNQPMPEITRPASSRPSREREQKRTRSQPKKESSDTYPIIVHCHLCWDWVWQRPQQFISRLSKRHPVLFVETVGPDPNLVAPHVRLMEKHEAHPNITRLRLQFPSWRWDDEAYVDRARRELVQEALRGPLQGQFDKAVQWFYDPMAVTA